MLLLKHIKQCKTFSECDLIVEIMHYNLIIK